MFGSATGRRARRGGSRRPAGPAQPWLDLEVARRRLVAADPRRAHNAILFRQPLTTLDDVLERGLRIEALGEIVEAFAAARPARRRRRGRSWTRRISRSGRRSSARRRSATSTPSSSTSRRCGSAARARSPRPGTGCRSSTSRTRRRSAGRAIRSGRRAGPRSSISSSRSGRSSTRPRSTCSEERAGEAIGGYLVVNDWSARDLQRDESTVRLGPAKGKDFATSIGPWIVTPDELADRVAATERPRPT